MWPLHLVSLTQQNLSQVHPRCGMFENYFSFKIKVNSFGDNFVCSDDISKDTTSPALDEIKCLPLSITLKTIQVL